MIKVTLIRAGGFMGKAMTATKNLPLDEESLIHELMNLKPKKNSAMRDNFHYTIVINDDKEFTIDREKVAGTLLKLLEQLEDQLKPL